MSYGSFPPERRLRRSHSLIPNGENMRKEYDFSKARKNSYAAMMKKPITIRLDEASILYFKSISEDVGIPYQSLINLYLRECAASQRKLELSWKDASAGRVES